MSFRTPARRSFVCYVKSSSATTIWPSSVIPRQTVYTWRGADPSLLLVEFARVYPDARIFPLDQNHRSTGVIVALGNALAAPLQYGGASWTSNVEGPRARLYGAADQDDEAQFVAHEFQRLVGSRAIDHPRPG